MVRSRLFIATLTLIQAILASHAQAEAEGHVVRSSSLLVEGFTAHTLGKGEFKLGSELEYGLTDHLMVGTDTLSLLLGIPTLAGKYEAWDNGEHKLALSLQAAHLSLNRLIPWAKVDEHYAKLEGTLLRPGLHWSRQLSERLCLHTALGSAAGHIDAELTDYGKRRSWEQKHPGGNYDERTVAAEQPSNWTGGNQEVRSTQTSNLSRRTLALQSLFGLSTSHFQLSGEFIRRDGNRILVTSRIERMALAGLQAESLRLTLAQHWLGSIFHFRLGIGVMYLSVSGFDLDGEKVDEHGLAPVSDLAFYWRF